MNRLIRTILAETPLFNGLPDEILDEIADISTMRDVRKSSIIFSEGDEGNGFYMVAEGMVKIFKLSSDGREQILHIFGPGEPFGEVAVFTGCNFPANAAAIRDSRIIFTDKGRFEELVKKHHTLAFNMLAVLSMRLRKFAALIESLSLKEVPGRLAAFILMMSEERNGKDEFQLDLTKVQVANILGTTPETLSRILRLMHEENLISYVRKNVSIIDRRRLEELSEGIIKLSRS